MINDLIHIIRNLESAFFFIIPVLLVLALFSKNIFKHNSAFRFLLTAGIIVLVIRILLVFTVNKLVGRYYLPVVIVWVCFAPAGVYCLAKIAQYLLKRFKQKINFELITAIIMVLILIGSGIKAFRISPKEFLNEFAVCLKPFDSPDTVLLAMTGTGRRINERLSGKIQIQRASHPKRSFYYWLDLFDKFEKTPFKYKNIFVVAKQRKKLKYPGDSFEQIFRSYYIIFPFDLVKKCDYKKDTYLLYRFNYKIADDLLPALTRNIKKLQSPDALKAEFPPQLNMPETIYVLPGGTRVFSPDFNALPDAPRYKSKFEFKGKTSSKGFIDISGKGGELKLTVRDQVLNTQTEAESSIKVVTAAKNLSAPVRILLLEPDASQFQKNDILLKTTLKKYGIKAKIVSLHDFISPKERFGYWSALRKINIIKDGIKRHPELFASAFDIVLINCGYDDVYLANKRWRINTEAQKMRQQLNIFIKDIQEIFPGAYIGIAMPVAPAPAASRYDTGVGSAKWFRKKLGHRALCQSLYNCLGGREDEKIFLLPLFHNIDPEKDYRITSKKLRAKGIKYWYPMALSKTGQQKSADSMTAWILYVEKEKKRK
ncbi:MAG: hypothetical protein KAS17_12745 [Victivallaceae bacterium]|nr:hypothetical protein [Victivallaceae bacterium]